MKPWDSFLPLVLPYCPGCTDLVAEDEIRNAAEDFFARSHAWRYDTAEINTVAGQASYTPTLPAGARIVRVYGGSLDSQTLGLAESDGYRFTIGTNDAVTVSLSPAPGADGMKLIVYAALTVSESAVSLPDELYNLHRLAVADGAIARLCDRPDAPYSNPTLALQRWGRFEAAIRTARADKSRGHTAAPKRVVAQFM